MKINSLTVTDDNGTTHTWDGLDGYLTTLDIRESGGSKQAPGRLVGKQVTASITVPTERLDAPRTVTRSAETGQFVDASEAVEHPDTTVTEQVHR